MKTMNKFLGLLFFVCLISGCELFNKDEINNNDPIIEMAWLKEDGSISDSITSDFLMVHKDGYEKAFFHDNYLVSILDSANVQSYYISFFDSAKAYVPSRIVYGDLEFVTSNFNENTFTFDVSIIYPDFINLKSTNDDKKVYQLLNQKFDIDTEQELIKLKKYVFGADVQEGNIERQLSQSAYIHTLMVGMADAIMSKDLFSYRDFMARYTVYPKTREMLVELVNRPYFKYLQQMNWKTRMFLGITESVAPNIGAYYFGDKVSLLLSGGFTIASCAGAVVPIAALGCAISVASFAKDAYDLYQKTYFSLNGVWDRNDFEIRIIDSVATFENIKYGAYLVGKDAGFISVGSQYLRNITKTGNSEWSCSALWLCIDTSGVAREVGWVSTASITMSSDGNTIKVIRVLNAVSQICGNSAVSTISYKRKGIKKSLNTDKHPLSRIIQPQAGIFYSGPCPQ